MGALSTSGAKLSIVYSIVIILQSLIEPQDGPTTTRTLGLVDLLDVLAQMKVTVKKH